MSIRLHLSHEFRRRLPLVLVGYVVACLVGGAVMISMMLLPWKSSGPFIVDTVFLSVGSLLVLFASMLISVFALVPSMIMLVYAARHTIRSPGWYAIAGMAVAVLGGIIHLLVAAVFEGAPTDNLAEAAFKGLLFDSILTLPAGLCAGLTFWAVAARRVGEKI